MLAQWDKNWFLVMNCHTHSPSLNEITFHCRSCKSLFHHPCFLLCSLDMLNGNISLLMWLHMDKYISSNIVISMWNFGAYLLCSAMTLWSIEVDSPISPLCIIEWSLQFHCYIRLSFISMYATQLGEAIICQYF